jgi:hypothetical protein
VAVSQKELWLRAERTLRSAGLRAVEKALSQARDRRVPPEVIVELVDFYRSHKGCWDADPAHEVGVLFPAIRAWRPGMHAGDEDETGHWMLWPTAARRSTVEREREAGAALAARNRIDDEARQRDLAQAARRAPYEAQIASMTDDELRALASEAPELGREYCRRAWPREGAIPRPLGFNVAAILTNALMARAEVPCL